MQMWKAQTATRVKFQYAHPTHRDHPQRHADRKVFNIPGLSLKWSIPQELYNAYRSLNLRVFHDYSSMTPAVCGYTTELQAISNTSYVSGFKRKRWATCSAVQILSLIHI